MTPEQKAEKLVLKFMNLQEPNYNWFHKELGKKCALIAVDEILSLNVFEDYSDWTNTIEYWEEVREEINKL
jgi:nitrogenase molybdenum-iron protein alpha/beta subunit